MGADTVNQKYQAYRIIESLRLHPASVLVGMISVVRYFIL